MTILKDRPDKGRSDEFLSDKGRSFIDNNEGRSLSRPRPESKADLTLSQKKVDVRRTRQKFSNCHSFGIWRKKIGISFTNSEILQFNFLILQVFFYWFYRFMYWFYSFISWSYTSFYYFYSYFYWHKSWAYWFYSTVYRFNISVYWFYSFVYWFYSCIWWLYCSAQV